MKKQILKLIEQEIEQEINNVTELPIKQKSSSAYSLGEQAKQQVEKEFAALTPEQQKKYLEILQNGKKLVEKVLEWENQVKGSNPEGILARKGRSGYLNPGTGQGLFRSAKKISFVYFPELFKWTQKLLQTNLFNNISREIAEKDAEKSFERKKNSDKYKELKGDLAKKKYEKTTIKNMQSNYLLAITLFDILEYIKNEYDIEGGTSKPEAVDEKLELVKNNGSEKESKFSLGELRALVNDIKEVEKYFPYKNEGWLHYPWFLAIKPYQEFFFKDKTNKAILDAVSAYHENSYIIPHHLSIFDLKGPPLEDQTPHDGAFFLSRHSIILDMMGVDRSKLKDDKEEPTVLPFRKKQEQPVSENKQPPIFLLEEMTKGEIKDLVKDEIKKNLDKLVRDELEKMLKDNKQVKNQIGDLSKEILKMLYKDLSIHHGYVIDRVRF